ncbi:integumentary mucin C.1-like isoform X3 [Entelurus aequoreus]|uniref:integumentary mucin C.1-like isoform X3 n=1 Tax=Entelurus aequoreus TaxID=161455 RepID=UPI002B1E8AC3|nr:integumentary mucin C.1-like isoform X3 [Entelurus aequoreus]
MAAIPPQLLRRPRMKEGIHRNVGVDSRHCYVKNARRESLDCMEATQVFNKVSHSKEESWRWDRCISGWLQQHNQEDFELDSRRATTTARPSSSTPQQTTARPSSSTPQQTTAGPSSSTPQQTTARPSSSTPQQTTAGPSSSTPQQTTARPSSSTPQQTTAGPSSSTPQTNAKHLERKRLMPPSPGYTAVRPAPTKQGEARLPASSGGTTTSLRRDQQLSRGGK